MYVGGKQSIINCEGRSASVGFFISRYEDIRSVSKSITVRTKLYWNKMGGFRVAPGIVSLELDRQDDHFTNGDEEVLGLPAPALHSGEHQKLVTLELLVPEVLQQVDL